MLIGAYTLRHSGGQCIARSAGSVAPTSNPRILRPPSVRAAVILSFRMRCYLVPDFRPISTASRLSSGMTAAPPFPPPELNPRHTKYASRYAGCRLSTVHYARDAMKDLHPVASNHDCAIGCIFRFTSVNSVAERAFLAALGLVLRLST